MKKITCALIIIICFLFNGCYITRVSADLTVARNLSDPIAIDFVFVFEQTALDELQKMPSSQWFAKKDQYKLDLELNDKIQILSYELVPSQKVQFTKFKAKSRFLAMIIYASYISQGDHRVILKDSSALEVALNKNDFVVKVIN